ncbi:MULTISPECIES: sugar transporter [Shimia]|uniref:sugar transporter n=1 Tax=Shimia TaxID=573139 RepID=UPI001FB2F71B|nr:MULTISPECIES: sugar transporter [Shimia]MDV4144712.1 sugar transporter [Shimia sp. FJ5]
MPDKNTNGTRSNAPRDGRERASRGPDQTAAFKSGRVRTSVSAPSPAKKRKGGARKRLRQAVKVEVRPIAVVASMRKRHWGIAASFAACVVFPVLVTMFYLWVIADDQYSSHTGFTVRSEETSGATDLLGGLASFAKVSTQTDADILYEYIQSQDIVQRIDDKLDLRTMYAAHWGSDPIFALGPNATIEDLHAYWERVVRISYDGSSGLINLEVLGFDPIEAQSVAQEIVNESQAMINTLNETAREDAMRYAETDLKQAVQRIKDARETLTRYRTRTQIVDPQTDIETRLGVLQNLQQQLAEALVEADILQQTTTENDPRLVQTRQKIEVIRSRIAHERKTFATAENEIGSLGEDYPTLIAEYESLTVDLEFAEQAYRAALTAFDVAKSNALRQSRYLATYVTPTRSQSSEYPRRFVISGLAAVLLTMLWGMGALVYYSLRDRR